MPPLSKRERNLWSRYRVTEAYYEKLHKKAKGRCQICGKKTKLCVDHCHDSNEIRGLLCKPCNTGLALLGDSIEGIKKALKYLKPNERKKHSTRSSAGRPASGSHVREFVRPRVRPQVGRDVRPPAAAGGKRHRSNVHGASGKPRMVGRYASRYGKKNTARGKGSRD